MSKKKVNKYVAMTKVGSKTDAEKEKLESDKKKGAIIGTILAIVISIIAIAIFFNLPEKDPAPPSMSYYVLNGRFVGSWDGKWNSHVDPMGGTNQKDFYLTELLSQPSYMAYDREGKLDASSAVSFYTGDMLGAIGYPELTDTFAALSESALGSDSLRRFALPLKADSGIEQVAMPRREFSLGFDKSGSLNTNSMTNLQKRPVEHEVKADEKQTEIVKATLSADGIVGDIEIFDAVLGDIDNDKKKELVALASVSENGAVIAQTCVVIDDDNTAQVAFTHKVESGEGKNSLSLLGTFDMNYDNSYELCLSYMSDVYGYCVTTSNVEGSGWTEVLSSYKGVRE